MAQPTKLELQQALAAQGRELEALRVEVSQLRADNEALRAKAAAQPRQWGPRPSSYTPAPPSPEQLRRREVMQFAKAYAMTNGRSITVAQAEEMMARAD